MEDREIVSLFLKRDEDAVKQTENKYGERCLSLARRILNSEEDALEAVNDTYLKAWNSIPPAAPEKLFPFLAMLCRSISIDILKKRKSQKRGSGEYELSVEELDYCLPDRLIQSDMDLFVLRDSLNAFLKKLPEKKRIIFMRRYWWFYSIKEISDDLNMSEGSVKMTLLRLREKLKEHLEREGFTI